MTLSFFGHADFRGNEDYKKQIFCFLEKFCVKDFIFYLGGYGGFDNFAYFVCDELKKSHNCKLVYVTPYLHKNMKEEKIKYDEIIYPPIENIPLKYAIIYRNKWMVENSDFVFFCVSHTWGGAYQMLEYAKKLKKPFFNLCRQWQ